MPEHIVMYGDSQIKIPEDDHIGKTPITRSIPRKGTIIIKQRCGADIFVLEKNEKK